MAFDFDPTASTVFKFLDLLSNWDYDVPTTTQWSVAIAPEMGRSGGVEEFFNLIGAYTEIDVDQSAIPSSLMRKVLSEVTQPATDGIGLYYAQSFKTPKEGFDVKSVGHSDTGGFLKGNVGGDRMGFAERKLTIEFLETNLDFSDTLIRPWIIASAYRGLIDRGPDNSLKADIFIEQYTKSTSDTGLKPIRKYHFFSGCMPLGIEGSEYNQEDDKIITKSVEFTYHTYKYRVYSQED